MVFKSQRIIYFFGLSRYVFIYRLFYCPKDELTEWDRISIYKNVRNNVTKKV